jgi:hypothetical protein
MNLLSATDEYSKAAAVEQRENEVAIPKAELRNPKEARSSKSKQSYCLTVSKPIKARHRCWVEICRPSRFPFVLIGEIRV